MILAADAESEKDDLFRQAERVALCALQLRCCLLCYGKVPRTEAPTKFAISIDTGPVATGLLSGNTPS